MFRHLAVGFDADFFRLGVVQQIFGTGDIQSRRNGPLKLFLDNA